MEDGLDHRHYHTSKKKKKAKRVEDSRAEANVYHGKVFLLKTVKESYGQGKRVINVKSGFTRCLFFKPFESWSRRNDGAAFFYLLFLFMAPIRLHPARHYKDYKASKRRTSRLSKRRSRIIAFMLMQERRD